jgi:hypothetical protein
VALASPSSVLLARRGGRRPGQRRAGAAAEFTPITAENGTPTSAGIAELAEATADPACRLPRGRSFARTVGFRVPADRQRASCASRARAAHDVLDLAAFVQPAGGNTVEPNACAGRGSGGADASIEPTAGVVLRVPAGRAVLFQVGRRGAPGSADDERAVLSLEARDLGATARPDGDEAGSATPVVRTGRTDAIALGGATITEEEPAQPACPALGSVWRRFVVPVAGVYAFRAEGAQVGTLSLFVGDRPTATTRRAAPTGSARTATSPSRARSRRADVWIRLGTDRRRATPAQR